MNINNQTQEQVIRKAINIIGSKGLRNSTLQSAIQATIDQGGVFNEIEISWYYNSFTALDEMLGTM